MQCFKRGHIWRVGDELQINVWDDAWIPTSAMRKVIMPRGANIITKVNDLINPVTWEWDEELVRSVFWPIDPNRFLQIPIAGICMEDFVAWNYTKKGMFPVKSTYHTQWDHQFGRRP